MNYGELRSHFLEILMRDDCSDSLANTFISMGIRRVERLLRTPLQIGVFSLIADESFDGEFSVPANYIGMREVRINSLNIPRITPAQAAAGMAGFIFQAGRIFLKYPYGAGDRIELEYYAEFDKSVADSDTTAFSLVLSDLVIYAALIFAADYFIDVRKAGFEMTFNQLVAEVERMDQIDEMSGGGLSVSPMGGGMI